MTNYQLSPRALQSVQQISTYTLKRFGRRQQKKYLRDLRTVMRAVAKNPSLGRDRGDIKSGYFSMTSGKHNIYYRKQPQHIEIIDVLHQSMEPTLHLE